MKLAEALLARAEYQAKLDNLQGRILNNLKVQEGDEPHEDPNELLGEAFALTDALGELIKCISARNHAAKLPDGRTLAEALTDRDMLLRKRGMLAAAVGKAGERDYRLTRAEIKMHVSLPVGELQKQIDALSRTYRELDTQIQALNWTIDL